MDRLLQRDAVLQVGALSQPTICMHDLLYTLLP